MDMLYGLVLLLATMSVSIGKYHKHHICPPPFGMKSFDAAKFQGDWYMVSQYMNVPFGPEAKMCLQLNYNPSGSGEQSDVEITLRIKRETNQTDVQMRCVPARSPEPSEKGGAVLVCALMQNEIDWYPTLQYQVLSTDYTSYAVTQWCLPYYDPHDDEFRRVFVLDVLSRSPSMPKEELQLLKSIASSGEADGEVFRDTDNVGC